MQQFLHDHNKPTLSFYEEMLKQKNEMEQIKLHESQAKENEEVSGYSTISLLKLKQNTK